MTQPHQGRGRAERKGREEEEVREEKIHRKIKMCVCGGGVTGLATGARGVDIWLGVDIYWEDNWVCWRLPVVFLYCGCSVPLRCKWRQHVCDE